MSKPLTTKEQTEVLKYIMKVLSKCDHCNSRKMAVWDVRSDGKAGRSWCIDCEWNGAWHYKQEGLIVK